MHGIHAPDDRTANDQYESQCCIAIDIKRFMPLTDFRRRMLTFIEDLKANPLAADSTEIMVPGERANRALEQSRREGVIVESDVAAELRAWAERLNIEFPFNSDLRTDTEETKNR